MVSNMDEDMDVNTDTDVDVLRAAGRHVTAGGWVQWQWAGRQAVLCSACDGGEWLCGGDERW